MGNEAQPGTLLGGAKAPAPAGNGTQGSAGKPGAPAPGQKAPATVAKTAPAGKTAAGKAPPKVQAKGTGKAPAAAPPKGAAKPAAQQSQEKNPQETEQEHEDNADRAEADNDPAEPLALQFPEGVVPNAELVEELTNLATAKGLTAEDLQPLVDRFAKVNGELAEQSQAAAAEARTKQLDGWEEQIRNDPEIGGEHFATNLAEAQRLIREYGDEDLANDLEETGFGSRPSFFRLISKLAKATAEDSTGTEEGSSEPTEEEAEAALHRKMYDHPTSQRMFQKGGG